MVEAPTRGEVYWAEFDPVRGSEVGKTRPALVIQNDPGNRNSNSTIVAAISSRYDGRERPFLVTLPDGTLSKDSIVNCAHIRTMDKSRLKPGPIAVLDPVTMARVDAALRVSLGL